MILLLEFFNSKKKISYLIKKENIFRRFYEDIYTIEYQKCSLFYIHFLIFLDSDDKILKISHIDEVIYAKLPIIKIDLTGELIKIVTLVFFYSLYGKINSNLLYMSNV